MSILFKSTLIGVLTADYIKQLIYKKHSDQYMHLGVNKELGLVPVLEIPLEAQVTGNCAWANIEAAIPTLLLLLLLKNAAGETDINIHKNASLAIFEQWREWSKDRALEDCIRDFDSASEAGKASKAAILAAVFFQTCRYTEPKDIERAEKIMSVLSIPKYAYVIESYRKVYEKLPKNMASENLLNLLELIYPKPR